MPEQPHPCGPRYCDDCDRFSAWYRFTGDEAEARAKALDLCVEQTIEFPVDLLPEGFPATDVIGRLERLENGPGDAWWGLITFPMSDTGFEIPQILNMLYGNISLKPGIRLEMLKDCMRLWEKFKGPRFGQEGLRKQLGVPQRALLATAVKPMGLSAQELADRAYLFARGGIDLIKDDHGLANQPFATFEERVNRCASAVARANHDSGYHSLYVPNVTAPAGELERRAKFAKACGAGALLVAPGLVGFDTMRRLADDDEIGLPLLAHPSFLGSFSSHPEHGISHHVLYGQMMRLAGADASIYPHAGGRFTFSESDCHAIVAGCQVPMGGLEKIFPMPGGGMTLKRAEELRRFYGNEVIYLVGGDLFRNDPDVVKNCETFRRLLEK